MDTGALSSCLLSFQALANLLYPITLEKKFHNLGIRTYTLNGDNIPHGLYSDLGFSPEDRF
jgi:adenylylsulfate kinase-like enzyme